LTDFSKHINLIDNFLSSDQCFALYRLPGKEEPLLLYQTGNFPVILKAVTELNGREGFVFAPFHISEKHPLLLINPDVQVSGWKEIGSFLASITPEKRETPDRQLSEKTLPDSDKTVYIRAFEKFIGELQAGRFDKLVLSRYTTIPCPPSFSLATTFIHACKKYPNAFVYLFHTPVSGTWMGSTPEILLKGGKGKYQTVALAGTRKAKTDSSAITRWDNKNKNEQSLVAGYLRTVLAQCAEEWSEEKTETLTAGNVIHLKTGFSFTYPQNNQLGNLLQQLHPTPAICGLPKEEAYRFILAEEGYDREYYSGITGYLAAHNPTDLYVNLRCMKMEDDCLRLFAGGGLLPSSTRETEWKETEEKLKTMRQII
jgi:isochorismate synthase